MLPPAGSAEQPRTTGSRRRRVPYAGAGRQAPTVARPAARGGGERPMVWLLRAGPVANVVAGGVAMAGLVAWASGPGVRAVLDGWRDGHWLGDFVDFASALDGPGLSAANYGKVALLLAGI